MQHHVLCMTHMLNTIPTDVSIYSDKNFLMHLFQTGQQLIITTKKFSAARSILDSKMTCWKKNGQNWC